MGLDRNDAFLRELLDRARAEDLPVRVARADLEAGDGLPLRAGSCGVLMVFRFLHRPLAPALVEALAPGGLLLYETFTIDQKDVPQGPSREAFLLKRGELPRLFPELWHVHHWEGWTAGPRPSALARLVARRRGSA